jgi:DNA repair protein RecO (recombination protein O)
VPVLRDRALLLKRFAFSESSLVAHLCTREHGRIHVLAKGAYRSSSRYFAVLDFLDTLEVEWQHDPKRDLGTLRSGSVLVRRRRIPEHPERWSAAGTMLELADLASRPGHPDPELHDLLEGGFAALEAGASDPGAILAAFDLGYLAVLGLAPSLETCAACGGEAPPLPNPGTDPRASFSAGAGGRLCRRCAEEARASGRRVGTLPVQTLDDARAFLAEGAAAGDRFTPARVDRVRDFAGRFLDYHLEARPRTHRAFLSTPNRNASPETVDAS